MRVVYMGTPDFAVAPLEAVISKHQVLCAVCQPDKQKGRGKRVQFPPVKEAALSHDIPVVQPRQARDKDFIEKIREYNPDIIVVAAFGQILPKEILDMPAFGCVNIHASLLPKYRGASPIQYAVINGEDKSGVTTMQMDEGIDTGDILLQREILLDKKETGGSLFDKLSKLGQGLILETMDGLMNGTVKRTPQDEAEASHVGMIKKEMGHMDFRKTAIELERLIRGLDPWPGTYAGLHGKTLKIWDADVITKDLLKNKFNLKSDPDKFVNGQVVFVAKQGMAVKTGEDFLFLKEVQPEGKKRMDCGAFLRGYEVKAGDRLE